MPLLFFGEAQKPILMFLCLIALPLHTTERKPLVVDLFRICRGLLKTMVDGSETGKEIEVFIIGFEKEFEDLIPDYYEEREEIENRK